VSRPAFDPWLAHLRRDRRGLPVPYINRWGPERPDAIRVAYDRHVGRPAVFADDTSDTEPDFTRQHMGRQRECMAAGLCQVCARPVPWSRRNLVVAPLSVEWVTLGGLRLPVVFEPWLDDRCAEIATKWCPALIRRRRDEQLIVHPVRSKRDAEQIASVGALDADPAVRGIMWVKLALNNLRILEATTDADR
jgi:hypothetical protein